MRLGYRKHNLLSLILNAIQLLTRKSQINFDFFLYFSNKSMYFICITKNHHFDITCLRRDDFIT